MKLALNPFIEKIVRKTVMDNEHGETMTVEAIDGWPFLKAQKEGGDPAVSGAGPSNAVEDDNGIASAGSNASDRYEIVVSNVVNADDLKHEGLQFGNAIVGTDPNVTSVAIDGTATVRYVLPNIYLIFYNNI